MPTHNERVADFLEAVAAELRRGTIGLVISAVSPVMTETDTCNGYEIGLRIVALYRLNSIVSEGLERITAAHP